MSVNRKRFESRSVFVTGGASGIGFATAKAFAAEGARVTITDINESAGVAASKAIEDDGGRVTFIAADATNESETASAIAAASSAFGAVRHAFNNVGAPRGRAIEDTTLEEWEWTLKLSLTATFLAMKYEIPVMRSAGGGTIVNTASNTARVYSNAAPPAYAAAKAGVVQLSHYGSCALGADHIRVNSVSPGLTATPLALENVPAEIRDTVTAGTQVIQRMTEPEEVAAAVLYLSSDEAAMVTGADLEIGGGRRF